MRSAALGLLLAGCAAGPETPCEELGDPALDVAPDGVAFGEFVDGDPLPVGDPPQGGAPYTPLRARLDGLDSPDKGVTVEMFGVDTDDGSDLGQLTTTTRPVCANVGESAGTWVLSSVHFRYFGWVLADLPGRNAEITVLVRDRRDGEIEATVRGPLTAM